MLLLDIRSLPAGKIAAVRRDRQGSENMKNQHHAKWRGADFSLAFLLGMLLNSDTFHIAVQHFLHVFDMFRLEPA